MFVKYLVLYEEAQDKESGFLNTARQLCEEGIMEEAQHESLLAHLSWLEHHLPRRPEFAQDQNAIDNPMTWLKAEAEAHCAHMEAIRQILEQNDVLVELLEVEKPGKIIYEDSFQVVAIPFVS
ncbi:MAG: hypothetical protein OHK0053_30740 [Microscillaceae bacterium]